jgi:uncharacterized membrane protein
VINSDQLMRIAQDAKAAEKQTSEVNGLFALIEGVRQSAKNGITLRILAEGLNGRAFGSAVITLWTEQIDKIADILQQLHIALAEAVTERIKETHGYVLAKELPIDGE